MDGAKGYTPQNHTSHSQRERDRQRKTEHEKIAMEVYGKKGDDWRSDRSRGRQRETTDRETSCQTTTDIPSWLRYLGVQALRCCLDVILYHRSKSRSEVVSVGGGVICCIGERIVDRFRGKCLSQVSVCSRGTRGL